MIIGWNLISGISNTIFLNEFYDPDEILIEGTMYRFQEGYQNTEFLIPGEGYWIRATDYGTIFLTF